MEDFDDFGDDFSDDGFENGIGERINRTNLHLMFVGDHIHKDMFEIRQVCFI